MSKRYAVHVDQTRLAAQPVMAGELVTVTNKGEVKPMSADTEVFAGVAMMDAALGRDVSIATAGCVVVTAGGAISAGDRVKAGPGGKVVKADSGGIGFAWTKAGKDGDLVEVQVR